MSECVDSHCFFVIEHLGGILEVVLIVMGGVMVVVVETTQYQGRSHFDSFHKQGGWMLALTAAGSGILEEVEVVVCISVVAVVPTLTVVSTIFISVVSCVLISCAIIDV